MRFLTDFLPIKPPSFLLVFSRAEQSSSVQCSAGCFFNACVFYASNPPPLLNCVLPVQNIIHSLEEDSGWDNTTVADLAKLFSDTLHACFRNAIKKISQNGYSKDTAEETVLKCGPFYGGINDMVSSIAGRALDYLQITNCHTWYRFDDINRLVEYMMLEMVTMLTYIKPSLSVHEAMWTLLICDLNVHVASEAEFDPHKCFIRRSPSKPQTQTQNETEIPSPDQEETIALNLTKPGRSDEKCRCCKKWCSGNKRNLTSFEKAFKGQISKKALKAKIVNLVDNKQPPSVSKENPRSPLKEIKEKPKVTTPKPFKTADYYLAGIPFDDSKGEHVPQDDQDKMILTAVGQLQSLQKQVKSWDDWASVKVMQVANRLSQDGPEIKKLKAEKVEAENLKKDKEATEESTKKKLSEMTAALTTTDCQFKMSTSTIARLESENSVLKRDKERAEKRSRIEANSLAEALCKELEALKKSEMCGSEKKLLEEELKSLKQEVGPKQRDLDKAKLLLKETETRLAQEEREAAKFYEEAKSIRNERERLEALAEAGGERAMKRAAKELKKVETEIKRLEYEIAALNLEAETKKIAGGMSWQGCEGFRNNLSHDECVMCLSEETTVLFVPCGHQVLCDECNVIHEDNGMKECPSCRTPIQKRINCLFAKSNANF
ncbi:putative transcription factor C2H2 family [Helianthus debilis subsp. tardiflorus]